MSLSISREIGLHLTNALVRAEPTIDLSGNVSVIFDDEFQSTDIAATISLDQLVANAGSSDMLEDEPEAASMLAGFRSRLLKSLEFVEKAIASLPKP